MADQDVAQLPSHPMPRDRVADSLGHDEADPDVRNVVGVWWDGVLGQVRDDATAGSTSPATDRGLEIA